MLQLFNRVVHQDFDKAHVNKKITLAVVATAMAGLMALVGAPLFSQSGAASQPTIQGVWRVTEITTTGPNASKNSSPQPSLYIYTAKHYSLIRINGTTSRPDLPTDQVAKATAAQLLAVYAPVLSAQSGTYEAAGGKLTTRAMVAKGTGPMAPGTFAVSSYKLDGTTLSITQERGFDGGEASRESNNVEADANRVRYARSWRRTLCNLSIRAGRTRIRRDSFESFISPSELCTSQSS